MFDSMWPCWLLFDPWLDLNSMRVNRHCAIDAVSMSPGLCIVLVSYDQTGNKLNPMTYHVRREEMITSTRWKR